MASDFSFQIVNDLRRVYAPIVHPRIDALPQALSDAKHGVLPTEPGDDLLRQVLIEEQWYDHKLNKGFSLRGSDGKLYYYSSWRASHNVFDQRGYCYCAEPLRPTYTDVDGFLRYREPYPKADKIAGTVLLLGSNAAKFFAIAYASPGNPEAPPTDYGGKI